jgi:hypothetical protein
VIILGVLEPHIHIGIHSAGFGLCQVYLALCLARALCNSSQESSTPPLLLFKLYLNKEHMAGADSSIFYVNIMSMKKIGSGSSHDQGIPFGLSSPVTPHPDSSGSRTGIPGLCGCIMVG